MSMGFSGDSDYSSDYTDLMCKTERLERELAEAKAQLAVAMAFLEKHANVTRQGIEFRAVIDHIKAIGGGE